MEPPTSPFSFVATARRPIVFNCGHNTSNVTAYDGSSVLVSNSLAASNNNVNLAAADAGMTSILPSSSSSSSSSSDMTSGTVGAQQHDVTSVVTPEIIKQPILLTLHQHHAQQQRLMQQQQQQQKQQQQLHSHIYTTSASNYAGTTIVPGVTYLSSSKVKLPTIPDFPTHGIGLDQYAAEHRCSMSTSSSSHLTEDSSFSLPATSSSSFPIGPPTNTAGAAGSPLSRPKTAHRRASSVTSSFGSSLRLNKFVRRLHDMLVTEKGGGIVEWRRGLLVLYSTTAFTKSILPKYFNTKNFKTFRRQLNYYGFVHVRSLSATGSTTTALWINQDLARDEANEDVAAVLKLHRVEPNDAGKTVEGRRKRKEKALHTVEEDIGLTSKTLQLDQIRTMAIRGEEFGTYSDDGIAAAATTTGTAGHITVAPSSATSSPRYISTTNLPRGSTVSTTSTSCDRSHQDRVGIPHEVQFPREQRSLSIISGTGSDDNNTSSSINVSNNAAAASMLLLLARS